MNIGGFYFEDWIIGKMMEEEKLQLDVLKHLIRKEEGYLGPVLLIQEVKDLVNAVYHVEETKLPMSKQEKRKAARERRKAKKEGGEEVVHNEPTLNPFDQSFVSPATQAVITIRDIIDENRDVYRRDRKHKEGNKVKTETRWLLKRDAIQKIADMGGIVSTVKTKIIDPSIDNNYLIAFDVEVTDSLGNKTSMIGEASDENTRGISQMYKVLTAERRGYQRAVLRHFRLSNIYGEDEFVTEDEIVPDVNDMDEKTGIDKPSPQEFKDIADYLNEMTTAKSKEDLEKVGLKVKEKKDTFTEKQLSFLRRFYEKALLKYEDTI